MSADRGTSSISGELVPQPDNERSATPIAAACSERNILINIPQSGVPLLAEFLRLVRELLFPSRGTLPPSGLRVTGKFPTGALGEQAQQFHRVQYRSFS